MASLSRLRIGRAVFLAAVATGLPPLAWAGPAEDAASNVYGQVHTTFGDRSALREHGAHPLTSAASPMHTLDGETAFTAPLSAPSSDAFLTLLVQPAASGDLQWVRVSQDLDLDGTAETAFTVPFAVSGVCANGVIGCAPGTWTNCTYHQWTAATDGAVSLERVDATALGGCSCINNDCGAELAWTNLSLLLRELGGGAVGAAQRVRPEWSVSAVAVNGPSILYYGQQTAALAEGPMPAPRYAADPDTVVADAESARVDQAGDPESLYALTLQAWEGAGTPRTALTCSQRREVTFESLSMGDIVSGVGTGQVRPCGGAGEDCIEIVVGREGFHYWTGNCTVYEERYRVWVRRPERILSATLARVQWDDYLQVWLGEDKVYHGPNEDFPPETGGRCELGTSWAGTPDLDVTSYFQREAEVEAKIRASIGGAGEGFAYVRLLVDTGCEPVPLLADTCTALETDPACVLQKESVDGVWTVRNAQPTGLIPLPGTRWVTAAGGCSREMTFPWWEKQRTYLCGGDEAFDFSDGEQRLATIEDSVDFAAGILDYSDQRRGEAGEWVVENGSIEVGLRPAESECERACKTRRRRENTQAGRSGHVAEQRLGTEGYDFFYKSCGPDATCPLEGGEELLTPCQCIDEFAEAASVLLSLRAAQDDLICSDGERK